MYKLFCIAFMAFWVGMSVSSVGQIPKQHAEPFSWWLPLSLLVVMGIPALSAYLAGVKDGDKS